MRQQFRWVLPIGLMAAVLGMAFFATNGQCDENGSNENNVDDHALNATCVTAIAENQSNRWIKEWLRKVECAELSETDEHYTATLCVAKPNSTPNNHPTQAENDFLNRWSGNYAVQKRRELTKRLNSDPIDRKRLAGEHGQVWNTEELQKDFLVEGFLSPFAIVRGKNDDKQAIMLFTQSPRFYFRFAE